MSDLLVDIQNDQEGRLLASTWFNDIPVIVQRKGVTENEIRERLGAVNKRSGKSGACILVLQPSGGVPYPDIPGPRLAIVVSFVILVHPTINNSGQGTKKTPEDIALNVLKLFHQVQLGYGSVLVAESDAIVPNDSFDGLVGFQVNFHTAAGPVTLPKVPFPVISATAASAPATVTIAESLSGSAIYYTTDDSYPSSQNTAANLYTVPFTQSTPATIRAAAEKTGFVQSDIRQLTLT